MQWYQWAEQLLVSFFVLVFLLKSYRVPTHNQLVVWVARLSMPLLRFLPRGLSFAVVDLRPLLWAMLCAMFLQALAYPDDYTWQFLMVYGGLATLSYLLNIMIFVLFVGVLVSWLPQALSNPVLNALNYISHKITEPIRALLPPMPLDFSPIIAIFLLQMALNLLHNIAVQI